MILNLSEEEMCKVLFGSVGFVVLVVIEVFVVKFVLDSFVKFV